MSTQKGHRYSIRVEKLRTDDAPTVQALEFEAHNHDDLLAIAAQVRAGSGLSPDEANALAIGVKLFADIMLRHRDDPLFAAVQPAVREFIGGLKTRMSGTA